MKNDRRSQIKAMLKARYTQVEMGKKLGGITKQRVGQLIKRWFSADEIKALRAR